MKRAAEGCPSALTSDSCLVDQGARPLSLSPSPGAPVGVGVGGGEVGTAHPSSLFPVAVALHAILYVPIG